MARSSTPRLIEDVVLVAGARTGFGSFGGSLKDLSATDLGVHVARAALERSGVRGKDVDHVIMGNTLQTSADAPYLARHVALKAGCPIETPALTVNRLCGSGFESIIQGARLIQLDEADLVLAGGTESMSQGPHVVRGIRWGARLGVSPPLEDLLWSALTDQYCGLPMAETAENLAVQYGLTRAEVDAVALRSQQRAREAWEKGHFGDEIALLTLTGRRGEVSFTADEHMRPDTTAEILAGLPPYFRKDGVVTAGNASGIVDGAAAVVVSSRKTAVSRGYPVLGHLRGWGVAGVEPSYMGIGPVPAVRQVLATTGLTLDDIDLIEVNEAFAPQYLAVERELGLDRDRTNIDGGAIAMGHPLAATGTRITLHLLHALRRTGGRYGIGSACIGGGQGIAVLVEATPASGGN